MSPLNQHPGYCLLPLSLSVSLFSWQAGSYSLHPLPTFPRRGPQSCPVPLGVGSALLAPLFYFGSITCCSLLWTESRPCPPQTRMWKLFAAP